MLNQLLLGMLLTVSPMDWRSEAFKKAEADVIAQIDQHPGSAVILELKRTSPTECEVLAEIFGKSRSFSMVAYPMSDTSKEPKFIRVINQDAYGMLGQTKSLKFKLTVPENESAMRFLMTVIRSERPTTYREFIPPTVKQLPVAKDETKILVFYVPKSN